MRTRMFTVVVAMIGLLALLNSPTAFATSGPKNVVATPTQNSVSVCFDAPRGSTWLVTFGDAQAFPDTAISAQSAKVGPKRHACASVAGLQPQTAYRFGITRPRAKPAPKYSFTTTATTPAQNVRATITANAVYLCFTAQAGSAWVIRVGDSAVFPSPEIGTFSVTADAKGRACVFVAGLKTATLYRFGIDPQGATATPAYSYTTGPATTVANLTQTITAHAATVCFDAPAGSAWVLHPGDSAVFPSPDIGTFPIIVGANGHACVKVGGLVASTYYRYGIDPQGVTPIATNAFITLAQ